MSRAFGLEASLARDCCEVTKFAGYKVRSIRAGDSTSRMTKPLDYPRVKLRLLVRVVGCKHGDLGQSSADRFDYGDNLPRPITSLPSYFLADSSAQRK